MDWWIWPIAVPFPVNTTIALALPLTIVVPWKISFNHVLLNSSARLELTENMMLVMSCFTAFISETMSMDLFTLSLSPVRSA